MGPVPDFHAEPPKYLERVGWKSYYCAVAGSVKGPARVRVRAFAKLSFQLGTPGGGLLSRAPHFCPAQPTLLGLGRLSYQLQLRSCFSFTPTLADEALILDYVLLLLAAACLGLHLALGLLRRVDQSDLSMVN